MRIRQWLGVGGLTLAAGIMLAEVIKLRQVEKAETPFSAPARSWPQPWGGYADRQRVRRAGSDWRLNPVAALSIIAGSAPLYPLDSLQWLDQAAIQATFKRPEAAETSLLKALAVQPARREILWSAAQIALQTGSGGLAESHLRHWLQDYPEDTEQVLFVARRWISGPDELLERMLPDGRQYLEQAMRVALRHRDPELAGAVWQRLKSPAGLGDPVFLQYVELLIELGMIDSAVSLWAAEDPDWRNGPLDHRLVNGQFTRPLTDQLGFAWRTAGAPVGVHIERDRAQWLSSPASLRISFNGMENVRLAAPKIRLPVRPGQHYTLTGSWRGQALTTRALPFLHLGDSLGQVDISLPVPVPDFDWQPWSIEFSVPDNSETLVLTVRRDPTRAFDRNIGGNLWLDDLYLIPADFKTAESQRPEPGSNTAEDMPHG